MAIHNPVTPCGVDANGNSVAASATAGLPTIETGVIAGERNPDSLTGYLAAVSECNYFAWATADNDQQVTASPALLLVVSVTTTTAGGAIEIRDSADNTGTVVLTIPAGATAGTVYSLFGLKLNNGIFIDDASTSGAFVMGWRVQ